MPFLHNLNAVNPFSAVPLKATWLLSPCVSGSSPLPTATSEMEELLSEVPGLEVVQVVRQCVSMIRALLLTSVASIKGMHSCCLWPGYLCVTISS